MAFDCIGLPPSGTQWGNGRDGAMVGLKALCTSPAEATMFAPSIRQLDRGHCQSCGDNSQKKEAEPLWLQVCLEQFFADRSLELDGGSQRVFKA